MNEENTQTEQLDFTDQETVRVEVERCGKCKRVKVSGKCPACGRLLLVFAEEEKKWNEKINKERKNIIAKHI